MTALFSVNKNAQPLWLQKFTSNRLTSCLLMKLLKLSLVSFSVSMLLALHFVLFSLDALVEQWKRRAKRSDLQFGTAI